jgi:hypothetical protein
MLPLTAITASQTDKSPWMTSIYAGVITAIAATATALLFQAEIPALYIIAFLLIGVGPVLGYDLAMGQLGRDWKPLIGGLLGFILLILGWILWPILVGAMSKQQSIGKLFVASIVGIVLGITALLLVGTAMGQNPSWIGFGFVLLWAVWGGACGALMTLWREPEA